LTEIFIVPPCGGQGNHHMNIHFEANARKRRCRLPMPESAAGTLTSFERFDSANAASQFICKAALQRVAVPAAHAAQLGGKSGSFVMR
jgi:hypothetical protein